MELLIASKNAHKIREFRSLLKRLENLDIFTLIDFPSYTPIEETGVTFEENAVLKATHAAQTLNKWAIADDSGLVVPALNGLPGIYSARFAGSNATDKDNRKKLLKEMAGFEGIRRMAYFECMLTLASPEGLVKSVRGISEGKITQEERGRHGFGYDSLFLKHDYNQTFAELDEHVKNQISHRAKAFGKMYLAIESLIAGREVSKGTL